MFGGFLEIGRMASRQPRTWGNVVADEPPRDKRYRIAGVDLGQAQDRAACTILERRHADPNFLGPRWPYVNLVKIRRYPQGCDYEVVADNLLMIPDLDVLVVEYNGVGRPVYDNLLRKRSSLGVNVAVVGILTAQSNSRVHELTMTRGQATSVPKIDLVSSINLLVQSGRLRIPDPKTTADPELRDGVETLLREMRDFQMRITRNANVTFGNVEKAGAHDDVVMCLAGDSPVETRGGPKSISEIVVGDLVVTRQGWKPVLWSGQTGIADTIRFDCYDSSFVLECTKDHRVWVVGRGWVRAIDLQPGFEVLTWQRSKQSYGMERSGEDTPSRNTQAIAPTFSDTTAIAIHPSTCTSRNGRRLMDLCRTGGTFITRTGIPQTTTCVILSACHRRNIGSDIGKSGERGESLQSNSLTYDGLGQKLGRGCGSTSLLPRGEGCLMRTEGRLKLPFKLCGSPESVAFVVEDTSACRGRCIAQAVAVSEPSRSSPSIPIPANGVASQSWRSNADGGFVVTRVRRVTESRRNVPVYDLTVADCPEFVAGGVLVHNSTAIAAWWMLNRSQRDPAIWMP